MTISQKSSVKSSTVQLFHVFRMELCMHLSAFSHLPGDPVYISHLLSGNDEALRIGGKRRSLIL